MSAAIAIRVTVNGVRHRRDVEPRLLLSDFLRQDLGLTGTHVGCEHGVCGACTILFDGERRRSCIMFAVQADGHDLRPWKRWPVRLASSTRFRAAFRNAHALQCGFCTPGILMTMTALLRDHPRPGGAEIRDALSANLCRCTGYQHIVEAVTRASRRHATLASASSGTRTRACSPAAPCSSTMCSCRDAARGVRAQRLRARAVERRRRVRSAQAAGRASRFTRSTTSATTPSRARCWCRRRRFRDSSFTSARRCRWRRTRSASSASRLRWSSPRAVTSRKTPCGTSSSTSSRSRRSSISRAALAAGAPRVHEQLSSNAAAHVVQRKGDYARARASADLVDQAALSLRPRRVRCDREPRRGGAVGRPGRRADHLGHDAGADSDQKRSGADARTARVAGERDRAVCRRRLRSQDHDVLPGGGGRALGGDAARTAAQVDRRSPGEFSRRRPRSAASCTMPRSR